MDALRESVGLRGYGQKDPLIEYKNEGYDMFLEMMTNAPQRDDSMFMFQPVPQSEVLALITFCSLSSTPIGTTRCFSSPGGARAQSQFIYISHVAF